MSDRPDSTLPLASGRSSTFRATFLWRFEDPRHVEGLETLGEILWEYLDELGQFGRAEEPLTVQELRAAARELQSTAGYLLDLDGERMFCDLSPQERQLSIQAGRWAVRVLKVVKQIEEALPPLALGG